MNGLELQIAEWRAYLAKAPAVHTTEVDDLEAHLRDQIADLNAVGLTGDEAFLVAVKRMGELDALSREFAREHSARLWKQLVLTGDTEQGSTSSEWAEVFTFAVAAAVAMQIARLIAGFPDETPTWLFRNLGLVVLPFLAAYFAHRRKLDVRRWMLSAVPFVLSAVVVNLFPYGSGSTTEVLVALHLPIVLWFAVAYPYMRGAVRASQLRMDFVRFTGEWAIYYVLIAIGGAVLLGLTRLILEPISPDVADRAVEWVLPSGAAGAVIVAAWLVESKQQVVENMAPVLTMLFTPLFAVMLAVAAVTYAVFGVGRAFDRELLGVFNALLLVVLGLVLYAISAREPTRPAGLMDRVQLAAIVAALALDGMVLGALVARIGDLGFTPNRLAALGLNLVLLVNLAGAALVSVRFLRREATFYRLERWQISYLPILATWAAIVVVVLPPVFRFE